MRQELINEILALPSAERIRLVEVIWESVDSSAETLPLREWQIEELDHRLAEFEADPRSGSAPEDVFARVRRRD